MKAVLQDFLIPFLTIAVAEMGDKTQLAMMALAAKYKHTLQIFLGAMAASAIVDGSAVVAGSYIARYLDRNIVAMIAGALFILFGLYFLLKKEEEKAAAVSKRSVFLAAFALFFVSEFGDKSQFAALLFGAQYNIALTVLGTLAGIASVLVIMLLAGRFVHKHLSEKAVRLGSSLLFIAIGLLTLAAAFRSN